MQSTLQELRDLPSYPKIVVRIFIVYLFIHAVSSLAFGIPVLIANSDITFTTDQTGAAIYFAFVGLGATLGFMQGFSGTAVVGTQLLVSRTI